MTGEKLTIDMLESLAEDIATLLRSHLDLPERGVEIRVETVTLAQKACVRIFAYTIDKAELFTVSVELKDPPPPGNLSLKSVFYK
jgi:dihydroneopterin aldolase